MLVFIKKEDSKTVVMIYFFSFSFLVGLHIGLICGQICPSGFTDAGGYCYNFTTGLTLSWDDAEAACENIGAHLLVEASPEEHLVFLSYRESLPQQGDPLWLGIHVTEEGTWSWLSDTSYSSPLYQNWQGGGMPMAHLGQCVKTYEYNNTQKWASWACSNPLSFICEIAPRKTSSGGGYTNSLAEYFRDWKKVYQDSTFQQSGVVVTANVTRTRSLVACAVSCTTVTGCMAFNHHRSDNKCQFILTEVNGTYVSSLLGWDVWIDLSQI